MTFPNQMVIVCGGRGQRISKITKKIPKPLIKFHRKPFLYYLINYYSYQGIKNFILLTSYKKHLFLDFLKNFEFKKVKIKILNEKKPLGTGGGLIKYKNYLDDIFFVTNGDTYQKIKLVEFYNNFINSKKNLGIGLVRSSDKPKLGNLILKKKIVYFSGKSNLINSGVYIFKKKALSATSSKIISLEQDIIKKDIKKKKVFGYFHNNFFIDIGSYKSIKKLKNVDVLSLKPPALFLDRDGVINRDYNYVYKIKDLKFEKKIFKIVKYYYEKNFIIIIVTNQSGIARKLFTKELMHKFNQLIFENFIKKKIVILDIYYCPHHPNDKCNCRKPKPQMINQAIKDWNIDRNKSLMIGDKVSDKKSAQRSKVSFIYKNTIDRNF